MSCIRPTASASPESVILPARAAQGDPHAQGEAPLPEPPPGQQPAVLGLPPPGAQLAAARLPLGVPPMDAVAALVAAGRAAIAGHADPQSPTSARAAVDHLLEAQADGAGVHFLAACGKLLGPAVMGRRDGQNALLAYLLDRAPDAIAVTDLSVHQRLAGLRHRATKLSRAGALGKSSFRRLLDASRTTFHGEEASHVAFVAGILRHEGKRLPPRARAALAGSVGLGANAATVDPTRLLLAAASGACVPMARGARAYLAGMGWEQIRVAVQGLGAAQVAPALDVLFACWEPPRLFAARWPALPWLVLLTHREPDAVATWFRILPAVEQGRTLQWLAAEGAVGAEAERYPALVHLRSCVAEVTRVGAASSLAAGERFPGRFTVLAMGAALRGWRPEDLTRHIARRVLEDHATLRAAGASGAAAWATLGADLQACEAAVRGMSAPSVAAVMRFALGEVLERHPVLHGDVLAATVALARPVITGFTPAEASAHVEGLLERLSLPPGAFQRWAADFEHAPALASCLMLLGPMALDAVGRLSEERPFLLASLAHQGGEPEALRRCATGLLAGSPAEPVGDLTFVLFELDRQSASAARVDDVLSLRLLPALLASSSTHPELAASVARGLLLPERWLPGRGLSPGKWLDRATARLVLEDRLRMLVPREELPAWTLAVPAGAYAAWVGACDGDLDAAWFKIPERLRRCLTAQYEEAYRRASGARREAADRSFADALARTETVAVLGALVRSSKRDTLTGLEWARALLPALRQPGIRDALPPAVVAPLLGRCEGLPGAAFVDVVMATVLPADPSGDDTEALAALFRRFPDGYPELLNHLAFSQPATLRILRIPPPPEHTGLWAAVWAGAVEYWAAGELPGRSTCDALLSLGGADLSMERRVQILQAPAHLQDIDEVVHRSVGFFCQALQRSQYVELPVVSPGEARPGIAGAHPGIAGALMRAPSACWEAPAVEKVGGFATAVLWAAGPHSPGALALPPITNTADVVRYAAFARAAGLAFSDRIQCTPAGLPLAAHPLAHAPGLRTWGARVLVPQMVFATLPRHPDGLEDYADGAHWFADAAPWEAPVKGRLAAWDGLLAQHEAACARRLEPFDPALLAAEGFGTHDKLFGVVHRVQSMQGRHLASRGPLAPEALAFETQLRAYAAAVTTQACEAGGPALDALVVSLRLLPRAVHKRTYCPHQAVHRGVLDASVDHALGTGSLDAVFELLPALLAQGLEPAQAVDALWRLSASERVAWRFPEGPRRAMALTRGGPRRLADAWAAMGSIIEVRRLVPGSVGEALEGFRAALGQFLASDATGWIHYGAHGETVRAGIVEDVGRACAEAGRRKHARVLAGDSVAVLAGVPEEQRRGFHAVILRAAPSLWRVTPDLDALPAAWLEDAVLDAPADAGLRPRERFVGAVLSLREGSGTRRAQVVEVVREVLANTPRAARLAGADVLDGILPFNPPLPTEQMVSVLRNGYGVAAGSSATLPACYALDPDLQAALDAPHVREGGDERGVTLMQLRAAAPCLTRAQAQVWTHVATAALAELHTGWRPGETFVREEHEAATLELLTCIGDGVLRIPQAQRGPLCGMLCAAIARNPEVSVYALRRVPASDPVEGLVAFATLVVMALSAPTVPDRLVEADGGVAGMALAMQVAADSDPAAFVPTQPAPPCHRLPQALVESANLGREPGPAWRRWCLQPQHAPEEGGITIMSFAPARVWPGYLRWLWWPEVEAAEIYSPRGLQVLRAVAEARTHRRTDAVAGVAQLEPGVDLPAAEHLVVAPLAVVG